MLVQFNNVIKKKMLGEICYKHDILRGQEFYQ